MTRETDGLFAVRWQTAAEPRAVITELKRYRIHYRINGAPASLLMSAFEEPSLEQIELEILLGHVRNPQAAIDAPWEAPERASEHRRMADLGVSDIQIEEDRH
nr:hypothetical protein [Stutzerimonas sp. S1]